MKSAHGLTALCVLTAVGASAPTTAKLTVSGSGRSKTGPFNGAAIVTAETER